MSQGQDQGGALGRVGDPRPQALEQVGDWWTLLIVREAFFGTTRFADFEERLGIAKNILSDRLQRLVANEIQIGRAHV
mgnify:CR=1 FL=1